MANPAATRKTTPATRFPGTTVQKKSAPDSKLIAKEVSAKERNTLFCFHRAKRKAMVDESTPETRAGATRRRLNP
jgi:hypothetical protein